jgi:hypothetical protein
VKPALLQDGTGRSRAAAALAVEDDRLVLELFEFADALVELAEGNVAGVEEVAGGVFAGSRTSITTASSRLMSWWPGPGNAATAAGR